jgi:hypothetical protein
MREISAGDLCTIGVELKDSKNSLSGEGRNPILFRNIKLLGFALSNENWAPAFAGVTNLDCAEVSEAQICHIGSRIRGNIPCK